MLKKEIISQLKKENLLGRSGSSFPTALKWEAVYNARAGKKYIICNASEGEPNVFKDGFILANYPKEVVGGIKIALNTIKKSEAYIYLRKDYYDKFKEVLEKLTTGFPIALFKKPGRYLAGEETVICEVIEDRMPFPRIKPPLPVQSGLWGFPTLINNVETFYYVAKIARNQYKKTRFYSITGQVKNEGVYELPLNWSVEKILKETGNWPDFVFFAQVGGGAIGEILLQNELQNPVSGIGSIIIYDNKKTNHLELMMKWTDFFAKENCDKCTPCREGVFRIAETIQKKEINRKLLEEIFFILGETSLCPLGRCISTPFRTLIEKVIYGKQV